MNINRKIAFGLFVVLFVVFWDFLDFLYTVLVIGNSYQFDKNVGLVYPIVPAIIIGYFVFLRKKG